MPGTQQRTSHRAGGMEWALINARRALARGGTVPRVTRNAPPGAVDGRLLLTSLVPASNP